jgi:hypothetical protein
MQNRKLYIILGVVILLVGGAAFIAGRMFSSGLGFTSESGPLRNGQVFISRDDILPAPELPTIAPEVTGVFVERIDNSVMIRIISFDSGVGGILNDSPLDENSGPKVEIVITGETTLYRETTDFGQARPGQDFSVQQTVEEDTLDNLNTQSMVTVWGRKNGDRVIAEVLLYMNPLMIQKPR